MKYGPVGLIKALVSTISEALGSFPKKYSRSGSEESPWDDIDTCDNDDDPGMKWWKKELQEKIDTKDQEDKTITKMLIEDYESEHLSNESENNQDTDNEIEETSSNENDGDDDTQSTGDTADDDSGSNDSSDTNFSIDFDNIDWDNIDWD